MIMGRIYMMRINKIKLLKLNNSFRKIGVFLTMLIAVSLSANLTNYAQLMKSADSGVTYKSVKIDGLDIFYREAGDKAKPTILLLHGFPTSSHMFRNLIPALADKFHLIAPDYPGFGLSSAPKVNEFNYTFENL